MKKDRVTYHDAIAFFRSIGKDDVANLLFIFRNKKGQLSGWDGHLKRLGFYNFIWGK